MSDYLIYPLLGFLIGVTPGLVLYLDGARRWGWRWLYDEWKTAWAARGEA